MIHVPRPDHLLIRDQLLKSTYRESDPNRRVIAICRRAEEMRRRRPGQDETLKRACFHACLEAVKAGRGAVERKKERAEGRPPV
ncbi:hypothetical protein PTH_2241 [Pelotomaculum thermopropionicum SI]|uniref:Uncharacterized protein n=1 Tax=Pelotomaculum thermopropionicum (strain DSM 13744 / JCM 10971 / SI) TaxID=370438 RepID=A5CZZ8_PELTS|nr:hypothetical protein PTH_2241 [Pelotomaculum thermopropionicum SI]